MNKAFYAKLAWQNIKKNRQFYAPYLLANVSTAAMFYIVAFMASNSGLAEMRGASVVSSFLNFGKIIVGLFAVILLFYTNSFLMKRRRKELGLYNILGMEKRHIARMLLWENLYAFCATAVGGILMGTVFSKLVFMFLLRLINCPVPLKFEFSPSAAGATLVLFGSIFVLILLNNLRSVHLTKPIELLHSVNVGEREPRTKLLMALVGAVCMGAGYYLAITTEDPMSAVALFFLAVVLVIIGTYCLFTAGSIVLLKLLRKNKSYYYQTKHFTLVSGMLFRMKQNAVGLGNICILSTMVLVTLSSTIALYVGTEDTLRNQYPYMLAVYSEEDGYRVVDEQALTRQLLDAAAGAGCKVTNFQTARYLEVSAEVSGPYAEGASIYKFICVDQKQHEALTGETLGLRQGQAAIWFGSIAKPQVEDHLSFLGQQFDLAVRLNSAPDLGTLKHPYSVQSYLVVPDRAALEALMAALPVPEGGVPAWETVRIGFDLEGSDEQLEACRNAFYDIVHQPRTVYDDQGNIEGCVYNDYMDCRWDAAEDFYASNGGFLFLGIFLGALFAMAAALIMYYKQISEGYDDKQRYEIMRNVGMSDREVKSAINSQILVVFFLPLTVAGLHLAGAFPMVTRILCLFNLTNTALFAWCTAGTLLAFALLYGVVYQFTSRVYYRIVK